MEVRADRRQPAIEQGYLSAVDGSGSKYMRTGGQAYITLRWLVICKKYLDKLSVCVTLVCADAEQLPFTDGEYSHLVADFVEYVYDGEDTIDYSV